MESERRDALAVSARAMPASAWTFSPYPRSEQVPHLVPNHGHKNRCESICRESSQYLFNFHPTAFLFCACERAKARVESMQWQRKLHAPERSTDQSVQRLISRLVAGDQQLDGDQRDDGDFQPQRAARVD